MCCRGTVTTPEITVPELRTATHITTGRFFAYLLLYFCMSIDSFLPPSNRDGSFYYKNPNGSTCEVTA